MKRSSLIQTLIIIIGLPVGLLLSKRSTTLHEISEHAIPIVHSNMDHGLLDVSNDAIIPEIEEVLISKDAMSGWNLLIKTHNFKFSPELVNQDHLPGHGHAHVYINNEKFARVYAPNFHVPELLGDKNIIKVTLNANGHEALTNNSKSIAVEMAIQ